MRSFIITAFLILGSLVSFAVCPDSADVTSGSINLHGTSLPNADSVRIDTLAGATLNSFSYAATKTGSTITGTAPAGVTEATQYEAIYFYSGGTLIDSCKTPGILPVSLLSFEAERVGTVNVIKWSTASEHNCQRFTLGKYVNGEIETIATTPCTNTNEVVQYELKDESTETTIYTLSQTDYDGTYEFLGTSKVYEIDDEVPLRIYRGNYMGVEDPNGNFVVKIYSRRVVKQLTIKTE